MKATKSQIKLIHALKSKLQIEEENYRTNLFGWFDVETSKDLDYAQAKQYIKKLEKEAIKKGVWQKTSWDMSHLDDRPDMATSAQLRKIKAMWKDVTGIKGSADREKALRSFILRIVKVADVRFVKKSMVKKLLKALSEMQKQQLKKQEVRQSV